ncbi:MAG: TolC family protein [Phycisphaerales bacterium]|jgi:outer membrane protein, heavy metal efflux system|nr:TolC family protein [Phycisphaerales bacterium]
MTRLTVLLILAMMLSGCYNPFDPPEEIVGSLDTPAGTLLAPAPQEPVDQLPASFDVSEALAYAWRSHPGMIRTRHIVRARHGAQAQAALWPNPVVGGGFQEEPDKKTRGIISLAQKFEIGGKADARVSLASANIFLAENQLIETWSALRAEIKEAFVRAEYARLNASLAKRIAQADQDRLELVTGLFKVGKASEAQTLKLTRQAARSKAISDQSQSIIDDAQRVLMIAIGQQPTTKPPKFVCSLDVKSPLSDQFDSLLKAANTSNPQLKTAAAQTAVAQAQLRLARTKRWSDLTVGMSYFQTDYRQGADDGGAVLINFSAPLPIWDRNQGNIASAAQNIKASQRQRELAALQAARQLSQLFSQRQRWKVDLDALDKKIIPASKRELKLIRSSLDSGKVSKLDEIKQRRELIALDLQKLELQLMTAVATIELENIAGLTVQSAGAAR